MDDKNQDEDAIDQKKQDHVAMEPLYPDGRKMDGNDGNNVPFVETKIYPPLPHPDAVVDGPAEPERLEWGTKFDFLLSTIGFAVDLANVWRFPYLCYRNGGGAFLIPYFIMMLFGALPLFYMELILGQCQQEGVVSLWKIAPIFKGIGWCACLISFYTAFYYNVIIAWSFYYMLMSFQAVLPWSNCGNPWNSEVCYDPYSNKTPNFSSPHQRSAHNIAKAPALEYFENHVLGIQHSNGIEDIGFPRWQLVLCSMFVFITLYFSLFKGVKSMGKAVWVTATMPYVVLLILLIRGVMLPGAGKGIIYFITPNLSRITDPQVWIDAAVQIFYSVGVGFGVHIAYSSYNKFENNCYRDCLAACMVNSFTSLFSGFVVFAYLGYMAFSKEVAIDHIATEGPGLVFVVYPEAVSTLPLPYIWSVIFFIMLLTLGLDSSFGGLESILTGIHDEYRKFFDRYKWSREISTGILCLSAFMFSVTFTTYGGVYVLTLFDTYAAGISILFVALCQSIAVSYFYGLDSFCRDAKSMFGFYPGLYWRICWKIISPIFLITVIISSLVSSTRLQYDNYIFPFWGNTIGWCLSFSSIILIPIFAVIIFLRAKGRTIGQKIAICISPTSEHDDILKGRPIKRFRLDHWINFGPIDFQDLFLPICCQDEIHDQPRVKHPPYKM